VTPKTNVVFLACHILWVLLALLSIMEKGMNRITGHGDLLMVSWFAASCTQSSMN
jgi:hypothetical protein